MEYQLIRSRRKTIAICVDRDGNVTVRAPLRAAQGIIDRFICEKQEWIEEKSSQMAANAAVRQEFRVSPGSTLPLMGKEYPVLRGERVAFDGTGFILPQEAFETLKPKLVRLYQSIALDVLSRRTEDYAVRTGFRPSGVRIGSARTCWGSCSGKNRLNYSWKLILVPPEQIDYVIVHELAHTVEHNHSPRFWALVGQVLPDYPARRRQLKASAQKLQQQGWD